MFRAFWIGFRVLHSFFGQCQAFHGQQSSSWWQKASIMQSHVSSAFSSVFTFAADLGTRRNDNIRQKEFSTLME
jgi:hypothetical protein